MPELGTIISSRKLGMSRASKYIWFECPQCKECRWLRLSETKRPNFTGLCIKCSSVKNAPKPTHGEAHSSWTGGRHRRSQGDYILVWIAPTDFFHPMVCRDNYVYEHRLIMAKYLKRCLLPWEVVHHKNGIKDDNRLENLELLPSQSKHIPYIQLERKVNKQAKLIEQLQRKVTELDIEITILKGEANAIRTK